MAVNDNLRYSKYYICTTGFTLNNLKLFKNNLGLILIFT